MLPLGQHPRWNLRAPSCANPCPSTPHVLCLFFFSRVEALDLMAFYWGLDARCKVMRIQVPPHFFHLEDSPVFFPGNF